jgi:hypothetical protein
MLGPDDDATRSMRRLDDDDILSMLMNDDTRSMLGPDDE